MIFGEIMRWREGDGGRARAEVVSRKVGSRADSRRFKALFNVRPRASAAPAGALWGGFDKFESINEIIKRRLNLIQLRRKK